MSVQGVTVDIPSDLPDQEHNRTIVYTELLEHLSRLTEAYTKINSALQGYGPSSHTRPYSVEEREKNLLQERVKIRSEFIEIRKQFIDLFDDLRPWLKEQQRQPEGKGLYAEQLEKLGIGALEKAQKVQPLQLMK